MKRRGSGPLREDSSRQKEAGTRDPECICGVRGKYLVLDKGQQVANVTGTEVAKIAGGGKRCWEWGLPECVGPYMTI